MSGLILPGGMGKPTEKEIIRATRAFLDVMQRFGASAVVGAPAKMAEHAEVQVALGHAVKNLFWELHARVNKKLALAEATLPVEMLDDYFGGIGGGIGMVLANLDPKLHAYAKATFDQAVRASFEVSTDAKNAVLPGITVAPGTIGEA